MAIIKDRHDTRDTNIPDKALDERREQVMKRLRSNEALEEDLDIANKKINTLKSDLNLVAQERDLWAEKIDELQLKLNLVMAAVADAQSRFEDSEYPFYTGMKTLKGILNHVNK